MNTDLNTLAAHLDLSGNHRRRLRYAFALACAQRVDCFLEDPAVRECLATLRRYVQGEASDSELGEAATLAAALANRHRGSPSLDGCGHAAVSASYAVANAVAGNALAAADYAAYAAVYGQGGYGAVSDAESFAPEHAWQLARLQELARSQDDRGE